jgi:hypothetical protein
LQFGEQIPPITGCKIFAASTENDKFTRIVYQLHNLQLGIRFENMKGKKPNVFFNDPSRIFFTFTQNIT